MPSITPDSQPAMRVVTDSAKGHSRPTNKKGSSILNCQAANGHTPIGHQYRYDRRQGDKENC